MKEKKDETEKKKAVKKKVPMRESNPRPLNLQTQCCYIVSPRMRIYDQTACICICNSMARSEIWDKFHKCCSVNGKNCTRQSRVQFCHSHYNTSEIYPKISLLAML